MGENFFPGIEVHFDGIPAYSKILTGNAIEVSTPARPTEGHVDVSLMYRSRPLTGKATGGKFIYQGTCMRPAVVFRSENLFPLFCFFFLFLLFRSAHAASNSPSLEYSFERMRKLCRRPGEPEHLTPAEVMIRAIEMLEAVAHHNNHKRPPPFNEVVYGGGGGYQGTGQYEEPQRDEYQRYGRSLGFIFTLFRG